MRGASLAVVPLLLLAAPTACSIAAAYPHTTLITGASVGSGKRRQALASAKCRACAAARRLDRLGRYAIIYSRTTRPQHSRRAARSPTRRSAALPEELPKDFGEVSVLLNNAGLAAGFGGVDAYSMKDMEVMMDTNVKASSLLQGVRPGMKKRGVGTSSTFHPSRARQRIQMERSTALRSTPWRP